MKRINENLKKAFGTTLVAIYITGIDQLFDIFHEDLLPIMLTISNLRAHTDSFLCSPHDIEGDDHTENLAWLDQDRQVNNIREDLEAQVALMHEKCQQNFEQKTAAHITKSYYHFLQAMAPRMTPWPRLIEVYGQIMINYALDIPTLYYELPDIDKGNLPLETFSQILQERILLSNDDQCTSKKCQGETMAVVLSTCESVKSRLNYLTRRFKSVSLSDNHHREEIEKQITKVQNLLETKITSLDITKTQEIQKIQNDLKRQLEKNKKEKERLRTTKVSQQLEEFDTSLKLLETRLLVMQSMFGVNTESFQELSESVRNTHYDGTCLWKIKNFEHCRRASQKAKKGALQG